jgi:hypothetical protein
MAQQNNNNLTAKLAFLEFVENGKIQEELKKLNFNDIDEVYDNLVVDDEINTQLQNLTIKYKEDMKNLEQIEGIMYSPEELKCINKYHNDRQEIFVKRSTEILENSDNLSWIWRQSSIIEARTITIKINNYITHTRILYNKDNKDKKYQITSSTFKELCDTEYESLIDIFNKLENNKYLKINLCVGKKNVKEVHGIYVKLIIPGGLAGLIRKED